MTSPLPAQDPRLYTRRHLHSAMRLTCTVVHKGNATAKVFVATGFVVQGDQRELWLVTNRHVLEPAYNPDYSAAWILEKLTVDGLVVHPYEDSPMHLEVEHPNPIFHSDDKVDVAMIKLDSNPDLHLSAFKQSDFVHEHEVLTDEIGVGSEFVMPGYPSLEDGTGTRPILVPGLVSSDLRYDAEYGVNTYAGQGLCHAFSRGGMSGAPLLTTVVREPFIKKDEDLERRVRILGVNSGHPREKRGVSSLSLFVPAWKLDELFAHQGSVSAQMRVKIGKATQSLIDQSTGGPTIDDDDGIDDDA